MILNRALSVAVVAIIALVAYFYLESQVRLTETLKSLADTDPLTGVGNRRFLLNQIDTTHRHCSASELNKTWALLMLSLDQYTDIKNQFGYRRADKVLVHCVNLIQSQLAQGQVMARYSGESFAIISPDVDALSVREFGEQLRKLVEQSKPFEDQHAITISVGYAVSSGHESSSLTLLSQADQALYCSRERGQNCVNSVVGLKALAS